MKVNIKNWIKKAFISNICQLFNRFIRRLLKKLEIFCSRNGRRSNGARRAGPDPPPIHPSLSVGPKRDLSKSIIIFRPVHYLFTGGEEAPSGTFLGSIHSYWGATLSHNNSLRLELGVIRLITNYEIINSQVNCYRTKFPIMRIAIWYPWVG